MNTTNTQDDIEQLRNIGPTSASWLRSVGIQTQSQLRDIGPVAAFLIVRSRFPKVSLNLLWALAAGIDRIDWRELSIEKKNELRAQLEQTTLSDTNSRQTTKKSGKGNGNDQR